MEEIAYDGSGLSRGLLYGDGLFETVRVLGGRALFLDYHRERFSRSAEALGYPAESFEAGINALDSLREVERDGLWRITVVRPQFGVPGAGVSGVYRAWRQAPPAVNQLELTTLRGFYFPGNFLAEYKTTSWLISVEALRRAWAQGFDEALLLSPQGQVGEAAAANVFVYLEGRWVTPAIDGVLPGVIRRVVLEEGRRAGLKIEERALMVEELEQAQAVALTSTGRLVAAATSLDGRLLEAAPVRQLQELLV